MLLKNIWADDRSWTTRRGTAPADHDLRPSTCGLDGHCALGGGRPWVLGRHAKVNDLWIAAVALPNNMDVVTRDDFDVIELAGGPAVIRVRPRALGPVAVASCHLAPCRRSRRTAGPTRVPGTTA